MAAQAPDDPVVLELTRDEARRVFLALQQYEPRWVTDCERSPAEQLAAIREEIHAVMWKVEVAILLGNVSRS